MLIRRSILISITGFIAEIIQIGLLNELTSGYIMVDLLLLLIYWTMLFVDITPAIFLITWLGFLRDLFTGNYIGANIICGLSIYSIFLLAREKLNEEDRYFQIIFTGIVTFLWMLSLNLIILKTGVNIFDIILKGIINGLLAPFLFKGIKQIEDKIENVFEGRQVRKHRSP
jgi:cell shape-determining protein MreD